MPPDSPPRVIFFRQIPHKAADEATEYLRDEFAGSRCFSLIEVTMLVAGDDNHR